MPELPVGPCDPCGPVLPVGPRFKIPVIGNPLIVSTPVRLDTIRVFASRLINSVSDGLPTEAFKEVTVRILVVSRLRHALCKTRAD